MALIAQMRLGHVAEVEKLAAPYLDPSRNLLNRASSLTLAAHLVFAELAERSGNKAYIELVRKAADLGFTETGEMRESMPFHEEMSDSIFMATPIVVKAGKLTGERKYFDLAARHFAFMQKLVPETGRFISPFASDRRGLGTRERFSGSGPGADAVRFPQGSSGVSAYDGRVPAAHVHPGEISG